MTLAPPRTPDWEDREDREWRYRMEREISHVQALLAERGPRRDRFEAEILQRLADFDRRLGVIEVLCKGTSDTALGKLSILVKDPIAVITLMMLWAVAANFGFNPLDLLK